MQIIRIQTQQVAVSLPVSAVPPLPPASAYEVYLNKRSHLMVSKLSATRLRQMAAMKREDATHSEIAQATGVSLWSVNKYLTMFAPEHR